MKKILLLLVVSAFSFTAFSQVKVGLRIAPGLSLNSVADKTSSDSIKYSKNGAGLAFSAGVNLDIFFSDNYALMVGAWYTTRTAGLKLQSSFSSMNFTQTMKVNLQYIQFPLALKVYTNELATNMKLNFTLGGTLDLKIAEKLKDSDPTIDEYKKIFQPMNIGVLVGSGVEYQTGGSVILFGGIYYNRGLLGQLKNTDDFKAKDAAKYGLSAISLELGAKF
ncbi:MAG: PorT family protein [Cytophagaceae bacterium]|nr:PorT family protein [Cytophagaceae bacterium]